MAGRSGLISELSDRLAVAGESERARMAEGLGGLLAGTAPALSAEHLDVFDDVLLRLADVIETGARRALAESLATLPRAPKGILGTLARDQIVVARPILVQSALLSDSDLIDIARLRGRDHMLAISERRMLSEPVTDVLVDEGDRVVVNAVAANPGARFSARGYSALVARSAGDDLLLARLKDRDDVPERHLPVLFELAKQAARQRIERDGLVRDNRTVGRAVDAVTRAMASEAETRARVYREACAEVERLFRSGELDEAALVSYANAGKPEHAVAAVALLAAIPLTLADRAVLSPGSDTILLVARAADISWPAIRRLLALRGAEAPGPAEIARLQEAYNNLSETTARRVVRFMHAQEAAGAAKARGRR
jgi:uncharacterized protein (DUF2336 family)